MLRLHAVLANFGHHVGEHLELIGHEWIRIDKVAFRFVAQKIAARAFEREEIAQNRALILVFVLQGQLRHLRFVEDTTLDNLIDRRAGKRQARRESSLDFREVVTDDKLIAVDGFLARYHNPHASGATRADFLHQRLQAQHEAYVIADELAHLVNHEQQAEAPAFLIRTARRIVAYHADKAVDRDHVVLSAVEPVARGGFAHAKRALKSLNHVVFEVGVRLAAFHPRHAVHLLERCAELVGFAPRLDEHLELRELQVLAAEAQMLEEHALERAQKRRFRRVAFLPLPALRVDVEEDRLGGHTGATAHLGIDHLVFELAVEVIDGRPATDHLVRQQV